MTTATRWPVWDWPVRVIHWYFPLGIAFMWWTGEEGKMEWHSWCGYSLLLASLTRFLWGFVGSYHARFATFLRGPGAVMDYLKGRWQGGAGHNPLGGWSALLLLLLVIAQASTGLFSNDDIAFEGPLAYWAGDWSSALTEWHEINWSILLGAMVVHIGAIVFYRFVKKINLVRPMLLGRDAERFAEQPPRSSWWAVIIILVLSGLLYLVISQAPQAPSYY